MDDPFVIDFGTVVQVKLLEAWHGHQVRKSCVSHLLIHRKCLEVDQACQVLKTLTADVSSADVEFLEGGKIGEVGKVFGVDR